MVVTAQAFAAGLGRLLLVVVPAIIAAVRARRVVLPEADGPLARLAEAILAVSLLVVLSEGLGLFSEFRLVPLALAVVTAAALSGLLRPARRADRLVARSRVRGGARRPSRQYAGAALPPLAASFVSTVEPPAPSPVGVAPPARRLPTPLRERLPGLGPLIVTALVIGVLATPWLASTVSAWSHGFRDYDTEQYHLTEAAFFAQSHNLARLHYISAGDAVSFYPLNVELIHAIGLLAFHADVMSLLVNPLALTLALLAAAAIARGSVRTGLASMCLVGLLFATPVLASTSSGSALNDTEVVAFFLAAVAFLGPVRRGGPSYLLAGLALGLALGTKYTALAPAGALLAVGWYVDPRTNWPSRAKAAGSLVAAAALTGSFWYVRDWVVTGSPLPALSLHLGPLVLHRLPLPI
ncbi:MAG: hypothetical protein ACYDB7_08470, partial [Mycobacteriales bacterium]